MNPAPDAGGRLARTLPGRFYHDPAIWQLEQERLFARLWISVGRGDQFPAAGHYRTVRAGFNDWVLEQLDLASDRSDAVGGLAPSG